MTVSWWTVSDRGSLAHAVSEEWTTLCGQEVRESGKEAVEGSPRCGVCRARASRSGVSKGPGGEPTVRKNFALAQRHIDALAQAADVEGVSQAAVVRRLIEEGLMS